MNEASYRRGDFHFDSDEILGLHEIHHEFYSRSLKNERDIIVWLPPSYASSHKKYPVLYMADGQNLFSPQTAFIGYDWKVDETASYLIEKNLIEEIIIVGVYNTKNRLEEYDLFTSKGNRYADFLVHELKQYIDEHYRTLPGHENTAIMGSSMGGLNAFQLAWNFPNVFGKAGCLSNSFWLDDKAVFKMVEETPAPSNLKLYLDCGTAETELFADNEKMFNLLISKGFIKNVNIMWHAEEGGVHSEIDWASRLHIPLQFLFGTQDEIIKNLD